MSHKMKQFQSFIGCQIDTENFVFFHVCAGSVDETFHQNKIKLFKFFANLNPFSLRKFQYVTPKSELMNPYSEVSEIIFKDNRNGRRVVLDEAVTCDRARVL